MKLLNRVLPVTVFLCICVFYISGFFAHASYLNKTVYGDGVYYFSWIRSAVIDHDVNFSDEYAKLGGNQPKTPSGLPGNKYSIGPAILWSPAYIAVNTIVKGDGYGFMYQLAAGLTGVLAALFGLLLLWRLLDAHFGKTVSIMTIAAVAGTTNLLFYGSVDTVNSHALGFFAGCIFLSLLFQKNKQWFFIGAALGLLTLIRAQDAVYAVLLLPYVRRINFVKIITGFLLIFSPQLIAWQLLYENFRINPYLVSNVEGFRLFSPHLLGVLFGLSSGLFLWTPIIILAAAGLIMNKRYNMLFVLFLELYIVSCWSVWWQGASFSGRMFVSSLPLLSFGIASIFSRLAEYKWTKAYYLATTIIPLSLINVSLIITFLLLH